MQIPIIAALALTTALAACLPSDGLAPIVPGPGAQPTAAPSLGATMSDSSVLGTYSDGTTFCEYHAPSGQILGSDRQGLYQGTWAASGNQLCYAYPQRGVANTCQEVSVQNQQITFFSNGQAYGGGSLVAGNAC